METRHKILVVDDEPSLTRMIKLNLEETGRFEVLAINDPLEAIPSIRSFQPELVFLDILMPKADGGDIASQIRSHPEFQKIPVVFLTALVSKDETRTGEVQSAGDVFLAKPVSVDRLVRCIEEQLKILDS